MLLIEVVVDNWLNVLFLIRWWRGFFCCCEGKELSRATVDDVVFDFWFEAAIIAALWEMVICLTFDWDEGNGLSTTNESLSDYNVKQKKTREMEK